MPVIHLAHTYIRRACSDTMDYISYSLVGYKVITPQPVLTRRPASGTRVINLSVICDLRGGVVNLTPKSLHRSQCFFLFVSSTTCLHVCACVGLCVGRNALCICFDSSSEA